MVYPIPEVELCDWTGRGLHISPVDVQRSDGVAERTFLQAPGTLYVACLSFSHSDAVNPF
jgi:hypothetical protein